MKKLIVILGILVLIAACGGGGGGGGTTGDGETGGGGGVGVIAGDNSVTEAQQEQVSVGILAATQAAFEASGIDAGKSLSAKATVTESCLGGGLVSVTNETLATFSSCVTDRAGWTFTLGGTMSGVDTSTLITIEHNYDVSATDGSSTLEFSVSGTEYINNVTDRLIVDDLTLTYNDYEYVFAANFLIVDEGVYTGSSTITVNSLVIECEFSAFDLNTATTSSIEALCDFENAS